MKLPSDFKIPFAWADRHPVFWEKCFYIPSHYLEHGKLGPILPNHPMLFEEEKPLAVEYCSGNGEWIAVKAKRCPEMNWIAVEKDFERARKVWLRIFREKIPNLCLVFGEALIFSSHYLADGSIAEIYVNFPDPWPRRRHAKHRLIRDPFVEQLHRILKPDGSVWITTDDPDYSEQTVKCFLKDSAWKSAYPDPFYVCDSIEFGTSYFHDLWTRRDRRIRHHRFYHG